MTYKLEKERRRQVGLITNVGLILLAVSAWAAQSVPDFRLIIALVTGMGVLAASFLIFKAVSAQENGDEPSSDSSDKSHETAISSSRSEAEEELRELFARHYKHVVAHAPSEGLSVAHGDTYWRVIDRISKRETARTKISSEAPSSYDVTMNIINVYVASQERPSDDKIDCYIMPLNEEYGEFGEFRDLSERVGPAVR